MTYDCTLGLFKSFLNTGFRSHAYRSFLTTIIKDLYSRLYKQNRQVLWERHLPVFMIREPLNKFLVIPFRD